MKCKQTCATSNNDSRELWRIGKRVRFALGCAGVSAALVLGYTTLTLAIHDIFGMQPAPYKLAGAPLLLAAADLCLLILLRVAFVDGCRLPRDMGKITDEALAAHLLLPFPVRVPVDAASIDCEEQFRVKD